MNPPGQRYDKPALNENEFIERYLERSLTITDRNRAARYLQHIEAYLWRLIHGVYVATSPRTAVCCGVWVSRLATFRASIGWRARACAALTCVYVAECDGRRPGVRLKSRQS